MIQDNHNRSINLDFLHKLCRDSHHMSIAYWIENEEFYTVISSKVVSGTTIDKKMVFDTMKRIYLENEERRKSGDSPDFNFYLARQGIKSVWKSISGSSEGWRL